MRTVELSNHPADALRVARRLRAACSQQSAAEFGEALARHELLLKRATNARDRARAHRQWTAWLRAALAVRKLRRLTPAAPPFPGPPSDAEEKLAAGVAGEQQVVTEFGRILGDDWVLLRGYCNRRGEVDHLLLGPPGLVAVESKHLNATVHCDGDSWRFEKFDRFGNLVSRGSLTDRAGRSPSVQLNEPADLLEQFLRTRAGTATILRVVLLTHPNSRCGVCRHENVHVATSALALAGQLNDMPPVLGAAQRARIEELIARDHRYHEERRPPRATPAAKPRAARTGRSARSASK
ncbi:MAG TPA: nuclease-related domain-containing protein [Streptosporangiaceae bacterium]|nr:nuclease-related domain-containing protein [Streptosporangiaceae bacterium]